MNTSGTLEAPGRAGVSRTARQVLQVVLFVAVWIFAVTALATRYESGVSVGGTTKAAGVSQIDARWVAKTQFATGLAASNQMPVLDTSWVAYKIARDEATAPKPQSP